MSKKLQSKTNGNIFKSIVRNVVQEELVKSEKRLERRLTLSLMEKIDDKFETSFTKYRNETVNKLDKVIGELKKGYEELTAHLGRHDATEKRLEDLEAIHPDGKHI